MVNQQELMAVSAMLNDSAQSMSISVKLKDGQSIKNPCDKKSWLMTAQQLAKRKDAQKVTVQAVVDEEEYQVLTITAKDAVLGKQVIEMTQEWNITSWAITREHKMGLIAEMSEWMCNVAKHDEASWLPEEDENLMHYITWVCEHVCRDDRYNPVFWRGFGFTDAEICRIIY